MKKPILKITTMAMAAILLLPISHVSAAETIGITTASEATGIFIDNTTIPAENIDTMIIENADDITPYAATTKYYVTADVLTVRSGPSKDSAKIGTLFKMQVINVQSINQGWAKFKYMGYTAYVSAKYLSLK